MILTDDIDNRYYKMGIPLNRVNKFSKISKILKIGQTYNLHPVPSRANEIDITKISNRDFLIHIMYEHKYQTTYDGKLNKKKILILKCNDFEIDMFWNEKMRIGSFIKRNAISLNSYVNDELVGKKILDKKMKVAIYKNFNQLYNSINDYLHW